MLHVCCFLNKKDNFKILYVSYENQVYPLRGKIDRRNSVCSGLGSIPFQFSGFRNALRKMELTPTLVKTYSLFLFIQTQTLASLEMYSGWGSGGFHAGFLSRFHSSGSLLGFSTGHQTGSAAELAEQLLLTQPVGFYHLTKHLVG
jgi:hypothetical protein